MSAFVSSFLGAKFRTNFHEGQVAPGENFRPPEGGDSLEWQAVLESVKAAGSRFTMVDLGAGYGWWGINAAAALKAENPRKTALITMVEAEPTHYRWLKEAIADNVYPGVRYRAVEAAVGVHKGQDWFYVGKPGEWYGQRIMQDYHRQLLKESAPEMRREAKDLVTSDGYRLHPVRVATLKDLFPWFGAVDLLDMDIQGTEGELIQSEAGLLARRVKRLFVSTHSPEIDQSVRDVLKAEWDLKASCELSLHDEDGHQYWTRV